MTRNNDNNMICQTCGLQVNTNVNFCPGCGNAPDAPAEPVTGAGHDTAGGTETPEGLDPGGARSFMGEGKPMPPSCTHCQAILREENRFCPQCGVPCDGGGDSPGAGSFSPGGSPEASQTPPAAQPSPAGGSSPSPAAADASRPCTPPDLEATPSGGDAPPGGTSVPAPDGSGQGGGFRIQRKGSGEAVVLRDGEELIVGKEHGELEVHDDGYISRSHLKLAVKGGCLSIEDLGSTNGSYLRVRGETRVSPGDQVIVGRTMLEISKE